MRTRALLAIVCAFSLSSCAPSAPSKAYIVVFSETLDATHHPFEQLRQSVEKPIEWCPVKADPKSQVHSFSAWSLGSGRMEELKQIGNAEEAELCLFLDRGPDKRIVGCSIRETGTGALLADAVLDEHGDDFHTELAATMERALARWSAPREDQTRLSFVVSSKLLDDAEAIHVDMFTDLIERRLSGASDVIVLPRLLSASGLDPVRLPDVDADAFVLLKLAADNSGVQCVGTVQDRDNEVISEFSFQPRQLDDNIAGDICREVHQALNLTERPDREWLPDLELKRRRAVAEAAGERKNHELAIRSLESALVLQADFDSELRLTNVILKGLQHWAPVRREVPAGNRLDLSLRWLPPQRQHITLRMFQLGRRATERIKGDSLEQLQRICSHPESFHRIYGQLQILRNSSFEQPALDRMWEDVRVQMVHHVPDWQRLVREDDSVTDSYHQFMHFRMQMLMWSWIDFAMERIADDSRAAGPVEVAMLWLDYFDSLPEEDRPWRVVNGILREATMPLGPGGPDLFEPLFQRLADHPSPVVQLYAARGRRMGEFKYSTPAIPVKVERVKEIRQQALSVLDHVRNAEDSDKTTAVLDFVRRTYEGLAFSMTPEMVQEFADVSHALLDRGVNPPSPIIEGLGRAGDQFLEEEIRVLERVVVIYPVPKIKARLAAARQQLEDTQSTADPD